jgi:hypothetical protein
MSILSLTILNIIRRNTLESFINLIEGDTNKIIKDNLYTMIYILFLLLITTIPAVLVAVNCNKSEPIKYGTLAFLLSDIYLLQWSIKKFVFKYPNYCLL